MLKTILIGNIGSDAELKTFDSGDKVANFSVAHSESYTKNGEKHTNTTWVSCSKFFKKDDSTKIVDYLKKGTKVAIEGTPSSRAWIKDNQAVSCLELRVLTIELLSKTETQQPTSNNIDDNSEDSLPF